MNILFADLPPNPLSKEEIEEYKALGFNAFILTEDDAKFTKGGIVTKEYKQAIENISECGLDVIIRNMYNDEDYFDNPTYKKSSNYGTEYEMEVRHITNEFAAFPKVIGFYAADEAYMNTLSTMPFRWAHRDKEKFASFDKLQKLVEWKNKYYPNAFFHVNHVPSESYDHYFPCGKNIYDYEDFLNSYVEKIIKKLNGGGRSICLDNYPFVGEGYMESSYLKDLFTAANITKKYNDGAACGQKALFGICVQAFHAHSMKAENERRHRDILRAEEITLQLYVGAALGAKLFEYFCYRSYEGGLDGIMRPDGAKRIYDLVKKANAAALPLLNEVSEYDWKGAFCIGGTVLCDNAVALIPAKNMFVKDENIDVESEYDLVIGCFEKAEEKGYMVVNYTDPSKKMSNKVRLEGNFKNVSVITEYGEKKSAEAKGSIELELLPGGGAFLLLNHQNGKKD